MMNQLEYDILDSYIDENGVRVITNARLYEVSVVPDDWCPPGSGCGWIESIEYNKLADGMVTSRP